MSEIIIYDEAEIHINFRPRISSALRKTSMGAVRALLAWLIETDAADSAELTFFMEDYLGDKGTAELIRYVDEEKLFSTASCDLKELGVYFRNLPGRWWVVGLINADSALVRALMKLMLAHIPGVSSCSPVYGMQQGGVDTINQYSERCLIMRTEDGEQHQLYLISRTKNKALSVTNKPGSPHGSVSFLPTTDLLKVVKAMHKAGWSPSPAEAAKIIKTWI